MQYYTKLLRELKEELARIEAQGDGIKKAIEVIESALNSDGQPTKRLGRPPGSKNKTAKQ